MGKFTLQTPEDFSFEHCFHFLQRSPNEVLHRVEASKVIKLLWIENEPVLFSVKPGSKSLSIEILSGTSSATGKEIVRQYVREWFDLETDLKPFYALAKKDDLLKNIVKQYAGYRIVGQPDLFESLVWAVLGQQINLAFAYKLKQRFVEEFGRALEMNNQVYFLFPTAETVSRLSADQLLKLQFSRQKAAYTIGIAKAFEEGRISKDKLSGMPLAEAKEELMRIKGIGNWTANYALMKTFHHPDAFPLEDAGLHNAIKNQLGLKSKPGLDRVRRIFRKYKGWEAYATLYLWKSL
jgi:DNA-3-methyladenine glycosylase II